MRYFVTGATGFVGSWVAQQLVEMGAEVVCLVRKTSNLRWIKDLPVEYCHGSLLDPESLKPGIENVDCVLHIAGVTKALSSPEYYTGNVQATRNILETTVAVNSKIKKFVFVSSQAATGPSAPGELKDESAPATPLTDYGKSKLQADELARDFMSQLPVTILRPPTVYGPRDTDVFEVFKNVKAGVNLKVGSRDPVVSIIHVFDLARGIILAAENSRSTGEIYNICNDDPCEWSEVVAILQKVMHKKVLNIPIPYSLAYGFGGVMELVAKIQGKPSILSRQKIREVNAGYWAFSNRKIKEQLGFEAQMSLEDGLRETYQWYVENGWL